MSDETPKDEESSWRDGESLIDAWLRQIPKQIDIIKQRLVEDYPIRWKSVDVLNKSLAMQPLMAFGVGGEDLAGKLALSAGLSALASLIEIDRQRRITSEKAESERRSAWEAKVEQALTVLALQPGVSEVSHKQIHDLFFLSADTVKP